MDHPNDTKAENASRLSLFRNIYFSEDDRPTKTTQGRKQWYVNKIRHQHVSDSSEDIVFHPQKEDSNVHVFEGWISAALDVYKGIFIIFMLTEHTRSSLKIDMTPAEPIMQFVSQVACALDMTCFSTAYGFSCYRSYLTNSKNRPLKSQISRLVRSVGLICCAAWLCNISFEMAVLQRPPTWSILMKIFSFEILYWDFLTTFPAMLLIAFVTTKPLMAIAAKSSPRSVFRYLIFAFLLMWPLWAASLAYETCPSTLSKYAAIFVGCIKRSLGVMRFSALTYMFYFNFGCIVSLLTLEFSRSGAVFTSVANTLKQPHWQLFFILYVVEFYYALPVFREYHRSWEYFNWNGYRRFPMTAPLVLAWGFMSQTVGLFALTLTALMRPRICYLAGKIPEIMKKALSYKCSLLEQFGANVLLYLVVSNITIHGFFNGEWRRYQKTENSKSAKSHQISIASWEWIVIAVAAGEIALTQLIIYLAKSSRK